MVSVLIPTYNYDITRLVKSLLKQFEEIEISYEIRIQDDFSTNTETDSYNKTLEKLPNCIYVKNPINKGRTATRHELALAAKYDWLLFMDADVLPKNNDFIKKFSINNLIVDLVFGGITYKETKPANNEILRWKYGRKREAKSVAERYKTPYLSIISQCFLVKKNVFLKANDFYDNVYGVDVLFAQNLEKMNTQILHIDNPIVHLGLESNAQFIEKSKNGLKSLYNFEKKLKIPQDYRPIQKAYLRLKDNYLLGGFIVIMHLIKKPVLKNLMSSKPSLFLFDLFRLNYFALLKLNPEIVKHKS